MRSKVVLFGFASSILLLLGMFPCNTYTICAVVASWVFCNTLWIFGDY